MRYEILIINTAKYGKNGKKLTKILTNKKIQQE
jgi:hypothetical protein